MHFLLNRDLPRWSLYKIMIDIIIISKPYDLLVWFLLTMCSITLSAYFNILFFSVITVNITRGLQILALLIIFESFAAYCRLKQSSANKAFICDFIEHFQTLLNQRILSANWNKIKLSDQVEIRRKIEQASLSIQRMIEYFFYQLPGFSKFIITVGTIFYISPIGTVMIMMVYICFYRFYLSRKSNDIQAVRLKSEETITKLNTTYSCANENMFEYVIHHEKDKIINITNDLKINVQRKWSIITYLYEKLSFEESILGKLCTFITLLFYVSINGTHVFLVPLHHHLSTLTSSIGDIMLFYVQFLKFTEDYEVIRPILEEYEERVNVKQVQLQDEIQIENLSFKYPDIRAMFHLRFEGLLKFQNGQSILVTEKVEQVS